MRLVRGRGDKPSSILFLGGVPGEDCRTGVAFSGQAGRELDQWIAHAGIYFGDFWVDYVYPTLVGSPKGKDHFLRVISECNPKVIVPLGEIAFNALTEQVGIAKWRGSILPFEFEGIPRLVVPTYDPSEILRGAYPLRWVAMLDLKRAFNESVNPTEPLPRDFITRPTYDETLVALNLLSRGDHITVDIETWRGGISCIGLTNDPSWAICIPLVFGHDSYWQKHQEETILQFIAQLFSRIPIWGQNLNFDLLHLRKLGIYGMPEHDSMHLHAANWIELPHSLAFLTSIYTNERYYKDDKEGSFTPSESLWKYNCKDTTYTDEIIRKLLEEQAAKGLSGAYTALYQRNHAVAIAMQQKGILKDATRTEELLAIVTKVQDRVDSLLKAYAGDDFNPGSPKQRIEFLYQTLGLPEHKHRLTGKPTSNEDAIRDLISKSSEPHPALELMIRTLDLRKAKSYLEASPDVDGRLRSNWNLSGTNTGRWSVTSSVFNTGFSLHTIPRGMCIHYPMHTICPDPLKLRQIIRADPGCAFIQSDQVQAEAVVVAAYAEDEEMFQAALLGNIHRLVASMVFGIPFATVSKTSSEYDIAKRCVHGCNYSMGPRLFSKLIGKSVAEGTSLRNRYHQLFPGIQGTYHREVREQLLRERKLTNPFGRERVFLDRISEDTFGKGYSFLPQSTVSDLTKLVMGDLEAKGIQVVIDHHDAVIIQCRVPEIPLMAQVLQETFACYPITIKTKTFIMGTELKVGENWGDLIPLERWNADKEIKGLDRDVS